MYSKFNSSRSHKTNELSLPVPASLVKKTVGLAIDMGGSMIKFVYRSRENLKEANNQPSSLPERCHRFTHCRRTRTSSDLCFCLRTISSGTLRSIVMYSKFNSSRSHKTNELSLPVPASLVKKTVGLAIDMGGSMIKFVYRSRENLKEATNESTIGHLQLVSFPKSDLSLALEYVKERCEFTRTPDGSPPEIHTTGLGCTVYGKRICEKLNIRLKNMTEFDCFANAFVYLAGHLSRRNLLEPYDDAAAEELIAMMKEQMELFSSFQTDENPTAFKPVHVDLDFSASLGKVVNDSDAPIDEAEDDMYPCILAMCGSGFGYFLVKQDKTFQVIDGSYRGGKAFHGMGTLLTGCKTYDELIELATHGDQRNVDVYSDSLFSTNGAVEGDTSVYAKASHTSHPQLIYCFGKAVEANLIDFRREDLARAWLNYMVLDIVQNICLLAQLHGVKRLFFCGSFCNSTLVRSTITTEIVRRSFITNALGTGQVLKFDFIKPGPYLGALGALFCGKEAKSS